MQVVGELIIGSKVWQGECTLSEMAGETKEAEPVYALLRLAPNTRACEKILFERAKAIIMVQPPLEETPLRSPSLPMPRSAIGKEAGTFLVSLYMIRLARSVGSGSKSSGRRTA